MNDAPFLIAALVAALSFPVQAHTAGVCVARSDLLPQLERKYGEVPVGVGVANGNLVELLTSKSGTWTIIWTNPRGLACLIGSGEGWQVLEPPELGDPS